MTPSYDLSVLLGRVEGATGPDRVLDFELHIAAVADEIWPVTDRRGRVTNPNSRMSDYLSTYRDVINADDQDFDFPRYTASINAALALVERAAPGLFVNLGYLGPTDMRACATLSHSYPDRPSFRGFAPRRQYALAILAALLRALIAQHRRAKSRFAAATDAKRKSEGGEA